MNNADETPQVEKPRRVLVIRNSEWLRGTGNTACSYLRDPNTGKCCCLGLDALDRGIPAELLNKRSYPVNIWGGEGVDEEYMEDWTRVPSSSLTERINNEDAHQAARINDVALFASRVSGPSVHSDSDRIELLRPIFLKKGIELDWRPYE